MNTVTESPLLVHAPQDIKSFVDHLISRLTEEGLYYAGPDRRAEVRHPIALRVVVTPLDVHLLSTGASFTATSRNISSRGIALVHTHAIAGPFLAVELTDIDGRRLQAAFEVLRCQSLTPYFEIAGKFVTKVYGPPAKPTARARADD